MRVPFGNQNWFHAELYGFVRASRQGTIFGLLNHLWFIPFRDILSVLEDISMVPRKKTDVVQLSKIRMREALRRKLERDAKREKTTLNAQIVKRIEDSFLDEERTEYMRKEVEKHQWDGEPETDPLEDYIQTEIANAKTRDTKILELLLANNTESATLLRLVAMELAASPDWSKTPSGKNEMADKLHYYALHGHSPRARTGDDL
jgi:hypothetical protein